MIRPPSKETWVLAVGLSVLVGGVVSRRYYPIRDEAQNVSIEPSLFNFGKTRQGQTLIHTFRLKNNGKEAIFITKSDSSCSCTTRARLEGTTIEAGSVVALPVTLKTGPGDGPEAGRVNYYYRSAARADAPVHDAAAQVTTDVDPDYRVRPTLIDFGTIDHLDPVVRTIYLRPEALADVSILRASGASNTLSAKWAQPAPGEHDIPVEVTFSGRSLWKSGPVESSVTLETNSQANPMTQVLARVRFVAPVEVTPDSIVIGSGIRGPVDREIRFEASRPIKIATTSSSDPAIQLAADGPAEGRTIRLRATIRDDDHRAINARVTIDLAAAPGTVAAGPRTVTIPFHRLAP